MYVHSHFGTMSPQAWIAIPDHPAQRDTERHARKAKHLMQPDPAHADVVAAIMPDGAVFKVDAHTRAHLWSQGIVTPPPLVRVSYWNCQTRQDLIDLYPKFDSRDAVEDTIDKVHGALRCVGWEPQSDLLRTRKFSAALRFVSREMHVSGSTLDMVRYWLPELKLLDRCGPTPARFPSGMVMAALVCFRRCGPAASSFWNDYAHDLGWKEGAKMSPVQALGVKLGDFKGESGSHKAAYTLYAFALSIFDRYSSGLDYEVKAKGGVAARSYGANTLATWAVAARTARRTWS